MKRSSSIALLLFSLILTFFIFGCSSKEEVELKSTNEVLQTPSPTAVATPTATPSPVPTPTPTPEPELFYEGEYEYYIDSNGAVITKYFASQLYDIIPEKLGGYPVIAIGDEAFAYVELHKIAIPNTVTTIGKRAFTSSYDCTNALVIPNSVTSIGEEAFMYTRIKSLTLSRNISYMGARAFVRCDLEKVTIPEGVTYIGEEAFYFNNWDNILEKMSIPSTVEYIGPNAFTQHFAAINITISNKNEHFKYENGALLSKDGKTLYECFYDASRKIYEIPDGVTTIKREAFRGCYNTKVIIPACVEDIEEASFTDFSVLNVELSTDNPFYKIENKTLLSADGSFLIAYFGSSVTYEIPNTVKRIGANAFAWCGALKKVVIPESVESIGNMAFGATGIKSVVIPESVLSIGENVFQSCLQLTDVTLSQTLTEISKGMFYNCSTLETIDIPPSVMQIGDYAFFGTAISEYDIPENVTWLGEWVFSYCEQLSYIVLPEQLNSIGKYAFAHTSIEEIRIPESVYYIGKGAFQWTKLRRIELPSGIDRIDDGMFLSCPELVEVKLPDSITRIGAEAFRQCTNLKNVILPKGLRFLDEASFYYCESLEKINIPGSVKRISNQAFLACKNLEEIIIEDGVQEIGYRAFDRGFSSLPLIITIPASVVRIDEYAFGSGHAGYGELTIHTTEGSFASQYATERGITCVYN